MNTPTNKKPPKQGSVAAAHQRISELEAKLKENGVATTPEAQKYQATGRVYRPNFSQAIPGNAGYHNYVSIRLEDEIVDGEVLPPAEEEVLALLRAQAEEEYPDCVRVELAGISVLPANW